MEDFYEIVSGVFMHTAKVEKPPECKFIGRETELNLCRAAFGISPEGTFDSEMPPLHFRLEGPPGVGKNEIVYEMARRLAESEGLPFYSIQGHEEMTPEDLSLLIVPDPGATGYLQFRLQASPLATALYEGGLFFFDEINRVPERALSPLASVLDRRCSLYSATTGVTIRPKDDVAKSRFRFCCALNPSLGMAGKGALPDYIDERTLPAIKVGYPSLDALREILTQNLISDAKMLNAFEKWYQDEGVVDISVRQAMALTSYAMRALQQGEELFDVFKRSARDFMRPEQMGRYIASGTKGENEGQKPKRATAKKTIASNSNGADETDSKA